MLRRLCGLALCLVAQTAGAAAAAQKDGLGDCRSGSQRLAQVELFFGVGQRSADGGAWRHFLARVVTPRFPDGLTVLDGIGQWRGPRGPVRESSRMIIIIYRPDSTSDARIEAIRSSYKARFKQQSVLRVDTSACVSF
jgi:hypothetical protein